MKLEGKVAVVTGAASGIGKAIAVLYGREGAKVVVADLNVIGARDTVEIIASTGGTAMAVLTNVAKEEDIQNLIDTAIKTYGTVDILVNNAGIMDNMDPAGDITDELWDRIFSVNTTSVMRSTRKVLPVFLPKVTVLSSILHRLAAIWKQGRCSIHCFKHAVIGFTKNVGFHIAQGYSLQCHSTWVSADQHKLHYDCPQ